MRFIRYRFVRGYIPFLLQSWALRIGFLMASMGLLFLIAFISGLIQPPTRRPEDWFFGIILGIIIFGFGVWIAVMAIQDHTPIWPFESKDRTKI